MPALAHLGQLQMCSAATHPPYPLCLPHPSAVLWYFVPVSYHPFGHILSKNSHFYTITGVDAAAHCSFLSPPF